MKSPVSLILAILIVLTLAGCSGRTSIVSSSAPATTQRTEAPMTEAPNQNERKDEIGSLETNGEKENEDGNTCYVCGTVYSEGGYIVDVGSESINMCKECRDELLIKNGFIIFDGKKEYPFSAYSLYTDELVSIPIPEDYHVTDMSEKFMSSNIWKAEFHNNSDNDVFIMFGWEDFFEGLFEEDVRPSTEDRLLCNMKQYYNIYNDSDSDDDTDVDNQLAALFATDEYANCMSLDLQGLKYLVIFYSRDLISMYTINDGVIYYYTAANLSDIDYDEDEQPDPALDMLILAASAIYPSTEEVITIFDS